MLNITRAAAVAAILLATFAGCAEDGAVEAGAGQDAGSQTTIPSVDTSDPAPPTSMDGPPSSPEEVAAMIDRAAEGLGEPDPTDVEWVHSTRQAANLLISESVVGADEPDLDVLVVQARGDFTVDGTSGPPDEETGRTSPAPTGTALTVIVDATSGRLLDFGVHPNPSDLSELGDVERGA